MTFRAVVFDLDGTLLDTLEDITQAANDVLAGLGLPAHPTGAYRPYDVPAPLDEMAARGLGLAVLSNKPDGFTRPCAAAYLARRPFGAVLGQRKGMPLKPDPDGAREMAERLAVPVERFLDVGDTAVDMEMARRAGMSPVGVVWGFRPAEELRSGGAAAIIERPADLLELLDGE